jgi:tRNA (guanine37-N1)-methyltransferase
MRPDEPDQVDPEMRIDVVSIFVDYLAPLKLSIVGRAWRSGLLDVRLHDLRQYAADRHRSVDDSPYGGGPGMVMRPDVWGTALDDVLGEDAAPPAVLVVPSPSGEPFTAGVAEELAGSGWLVFACGRYEGIDARVMEHYQHRCQVREVSIGDVVLAGGEAATLVMIEAIARLLPGVLGNPASAADDSFAPGRAGGPLEGPVYTRPPEWRGLAVPPVLVSGDHGEISRWRAEQSADRSRDRRPDLVPPQAP